MKLQELASALLITHIHGDNNTEITGIEADSRKIKPGDLFFCIPGLLVDGHDYAPKAIALGASALVTERVLDVTVPQLVVKDARYAMAALSAHFFGYPSKEIKIIGITGTNGKTTSTYILEKIIADQGYVTGLMGNIHIKIGESYIVNKATNTQESIELQRILRNMADRGVQYCVMEVTSNGLDMGRVKGVHFRSSIFTNLTQDHLNEHKTMEAYAAAKGLLFGRLGNGFSADPDARQYAILNVDDEASHMLHKLTAAQVITYGIEKECDVRATNIRISAKGTEFQLKSFAGDAFLRMQLVGKFNVYNALGAIATALAEGFALEAIRDSLEGIAFVEGRMEVVNEGQDFLVLVDYAHTPDGLDNALSTVREFAEGRIITVFGCGGDRDRTKRPIMGEVVAKYSDFIYVTSDNPRTEDPEAILADIVPGLIGMHYPENQYMLLADRKKAIQKAIEGAGPKDVILIAGKGHETYQDIMGVKHDFDDRLVAKAAIRERTQ
ncbi:UDP-N-acetylmuramoyl-L-alanyl-D-glutamate--2,6-diaminopimelate ligase [Paenibacillus qinlingensis]|uniref:UDP-N-acetylmuramoyl-L-alanyl-D-glutamate--2,6-diaminopimelate ligase n=1 Tax=Paenibacillus qinlingensis TaxID=1837343 RepID=A0ABU1NVA5_9BACL|nr:UDP-N-acetylmuramoyl-L-alanyl-D-glutamate--2,6-diaminopimelate ligase [Paenibacillus qinlingensis]MDR6551375.1 UDP-N-acetylmuramoyl-L-alanyl-D-glutamate--2,6-diaminopimelate ligase [Paenibacillus qinlingensis]